MLSPTTTDLTNDIKKLMNPEDEAEWHKRGFFKDLDSVEVSTGSHLHLTFHTNSGPSPSTPYLNVSLVFPSLSPHHTLLPFENCPASKTNSLLHPIGPGVPCRELTGFVSSVRGRFVRHVSMQTGIRKKVSKPNKKIRKMVLGDDVGLEEAVRLAMCGLVGRLSYAYLASCPVEEWMLTHWKPLMGYVPKILHLTKGWMGFICRSPEDASLLQQFNVKEIEG